MSTRAIRGATQLSIDTPQEMNGAVVELISEILRSNNLQIENLISVFFTSTKDLVSEFPAAAARGMGLGNTPLICSVEIDVPNSLPRVIRVLIHCESDLKKSEITHIYLRGASALRKDLAQ